MANIRDLKKDVAFLTNDLLTSICLKNAIEGTDKTKTSELIVEVLAYRDEFRSKINAPAISVAKSDKAAYAKAVKSAFRTIRKEAFDKYAAIAEEIGKLK